MSERNYFCFSEDNCKFETLNREQIVAAIAEATGTTPTHIDDAFITKIKELNANNALKFWAGTNAQYNAIEHENDVVYIITDADPIADINESLIDIYRKLSTIADHVIFDDDISDGWHARLWTTGKIEISKQQTFSNVAFSSWPPVYTSSTLRANLPAGVIQTADNSIVTINNVMLVIGGTNATNTNTQFRIFSFTELEPQNITARILVTGTATPEFIAAKTDGIY